MYINMQKKEKISSQTLYPSQKSTEVKHNPKYERQSSKTPEDNTGKNLDDPGYCITTPKTQPIKK